MRISYEQYTHEVVEAVQMPCFCSCVLNGIAPYDRYCCVISQRRKNDDGQAQQLAMIRTVLLNLPRSMLLYSVAQQGLNIHIVISVMSCLSQECPTHAAQESLVLAEKDEGHGIHGKTQNTPKAKVFYHHIIATHHFLMP